MTLRVLAEAGHRRVVGPLQVGRRVPRPVVRLRHHRLRPGSPGLPGLPGRAASRSTGATRTRPRSRAPTRSGWPPSGATLTRSASGSSRSCRSPARRGAGRHHARRVNARSTDPALPPPPRRTPATRLAWDGPDDAAAAVAEGRAASPTAWAASSRDRLPAGRHHHLAQGSGRRRPPRSSPNSSACPSASTTGWPGSSALGALERHPRAMPATRPARPRRPRSRLQRPRRRSLCGAAGIPMRKGALARIDIDRPLRRATARCAGCSRPTCSSPLATGESPAFAVRPRARPGAIGPARAAAGTSRAAGQLGGKGGRRSATSGASR